jgi:hypothetical protein
MAKQTVQGSCHCGAVRFEADLDLAAGTSKCNCSICAKTRNWEVIVKPEAFRLLAGEGELSSYEFGSKSAHHVFCRRCGVHTFGRGYVEAIGGDYRAVRLACLDGVDDTTLANAPVTFMDGRHDAWQRTPGETRHL